MTPSKPKLEKEVAGAPVVEPEAAVEEIGPVAAVVAVKRSAGPKEPVPFEWKIVGESDGAIITLFKSVEREDADAQLERLQRDGYYQKIRILGAREVIKQPPSAKDAFTPTKSVKAPPPPPPKPKRSAKKAEAQKQRTALTKPAAAKVEKVRPKPKAAAKKPTPKPAPKTPPKKAARKAPPRKKK